MKVILLQTAIADYRNKFIETLSQKYKENNIEFIIISGEKYFEESTKTSDFVLSLENTKKARNVFLLGRKALLQIYPLREALSADVVVCELNPRILNTWLIVFLRRILRKRVVVWGHAWPRQGQNSKTDFVRSIIRNTAHAVLLYTESQKSDLASKGCNSELFVAPNSLYSESDFSNVFSESSESIIYVGRLVQAKKISLLIKGASRLLKEHPKTRLEIVGTGPETDALQNLCETLGIADKVIFHGHISSHQKLKEIYSRSLVSVSPGYVGLSITQSFSFGIPMLIADNEPHSPEIEAFVPGLNGYFFSSDSPDDLFQKLLKCYQKRDETQKISNKIITDCIERYSAEKMAAGFYESTISKHRSPDKPMNLVLSSIRKILREARWLKIKASNIGKKIKRGENCYFGKNAEIYIPESIELGNNISFGSNTISQVNLCVGNDCLVSSKVSFIGNDHELFDTNTTSYFSGRNPPSKITLEGNNFIGFGSTLLGNITIGKDSIVAANSFVNKDIPPNCIVAGVPARIIRNRY